MRSDFYNARKFHVDHCPDREATGRGVLKLVVRPYRKIGQDGYGVDRVSLDLEPKRVIDNRSRFLFNGMVRQIRRWSNARNM